MPTQEELQSQIIDLQGQINHLTDVYYRTHSIDKDVFQNAVYLNGKVYFKNGSTISLGVATGGIVGATGEKIGFLGHAPVARQSAITAPTGGATIDAEARTAINTLILVLKTFGLTS